MTDDKGSTGPHPIETNGPPSVASGEPQLTLPENGRHGQPTMDELLARIRRLEEQYAALQDTKQLEERVAQRVSTRLRRKAVTNMRLPESSPAASDAPPPSEVPLPGEPSAPVPMLSLPDSPAPMAKAVPADAASTAIAPVATVIALPAPLPDPPVAAVAPVMAGPSPPPTAKSSRLGWVWRSWLLLDVLHELRVMLRMLVDPRFRMTWPARIMPLVAFALIFLSDIEKLDLLFPWKLAPGLGYFLNKLFQIALMFIMFKVLEREVDRYRELVPDAPRPLQSR